MFCLLKEVSMQRVIFATIAVLATLVLATSAGWAGSPHFIEVTVTRTDDTLCTSGKEAGLGNEDAVQIQISGTALCINGGGSHPKAVNKEGFSEAGTFPVQNGKADFDGPELCGTAVFQPSCSPPMTVEFTGVQVCDLTNNICVSFSGTF
jgi:hypothetical protein